MDLPQKKAKVKVDQTMESNRERTEILTGSGHETVTGSGQETVTGRSVTVQAVAQYWLGLAAQSFPLIESVRVFYSVRLKCSTTENADEVARQAKIALLYIQVAQPRVYG